MKFFERLRRVQPVQLILTMLVVNFLFLSIDLGIASFYYQSIVTVNSQILRLGESNKVLNQQILNLTEAVHRADKLDVIQTNALLQKLEKMTTASRDLLVVLVRHQDQHFDATADQINLLKFRIEQTQNDSNDLKQIFLHEESLIKLLLNRTADNHPR